MADPVDSKELVRMLRTKAWRCRTGILLVSGESLGQEATIAARLNIQHVDLVEYLIQNAPPESAYIGLTLEGLFGIIDDIANSASGMDCVLVSNIDVGTANLTSKERTELWQRLMRDFPHRRKSVVFGVPAHLDGIRVLQEASILAQWENDNRLGRWQNR